MEQMNCIFAIEGKIVLNQGETGSHRSHYYRLWTRYLQVFDSVTVFGPVFFP